MLLSMSYTVACCITSFTFNRSRQWLFSIWGPQTSNLLQMIRVMNTRSDSVWALMQCSLTTNQNVIMIKHKLSHEICSLNSVCSYRKSENFRVQKFLCKKFLSKKFSNASVCPKIKNTNNFWTGEKITIISNHVKDHGRTAKGVVHSRTPHVEKEIWDPAIGEVVQCERKPRNEVDRYSVAIMKGGVVVEHFTRRISRLCSLFLWQRGTAEKFLCF